ncbi:HlyD family efflux transporter periplasmic adaptor subunit [Salmonella enterica subsp. enterica serovar Typhimurium]|nr:HlyD family efflux transporter periplasmic adaptor subunit [Salmonella enterica subsp. enterica serovar Typhimurium]
MQDEKPTQNNARKKTIFIFPLAIVICLAAYGLWRYAGSHAATTEDAYVEGNLVQVSSLVGGTITGIHADNTDYVKQGDVVVTINQIDTRVQLDKARAQLASTVRGVRNQFANLQQLEAAIELKRADYNKAIADYRRRSGLSKSMAISVEDMSHAGDAVNSARAAVKVAQSQYNAALAYTSDITTETHPDVIAAEAVFRQAWLDWHRTQVIVPVDGYVAQRSVQVGQHISAGSTLMSVVPLDSVWVTANFKETQLGNIRSGQSVSLTSDVYGRSVTYSGKVLGIEPGTGSAFSLLPAQNATGNWIKVVQRVPVRIVLDKSQLKTHPLRPGLSMKVTVSTRKDGQGELKAAPPNMQKWNTAVYQNEDATVNELIKAVVKENE